MTPNYLARASKLDRGKHAMSGTLRISVGIGDVVTIEFVPARPQNHIYQATARSREELKKQLEFLGVPVGQHPKILAARTSWSREVTLLPTPAAWGQLGGGARGTGAA